MQAAVDAPERLCEASPAASEEGFLPERMAESFDDSEFYQQLLGEFLEAAGSSLHTVAAPAVPKVGPVQPSTPAGSAECGAWPCLHVSLALSMVTSECTGFCKSVSDPASM